MAMIIQFGVVKEASRISYHEWQQSIGVIWNKHWTFGATLMDPSFCSRVRNSRSFRNTTMNPLENENGNDYQKISKDLKLFVFLRADKSYS
jgi:hypothetical protein